MNLRDPPPGARTRPSISILSISQSFRSPPSSSPFTRGSSVRHAVVSRVSRVCREVRRFSTPHRSSPSRRAHAVRGTAWWIGKKKQAPSNRVRLQLRHPIFLLCLALAATVHFPLPVLPRGILSSTTPRPTSNSSPLETLTSDGRRIMGVRRLPLLLRSNLGPMARRRTRTRPPRGRADGPLPPSIYSPSLLGPRIRLFASS